MVQGYIDYVDRGGDELKQNLLECKDSIDLGDEFNLNDRGQPRKEPKWKIALYLAQFVVLDMCLPVILYHALRWHIGELHATLISSLPLLVSCILTFAIQRSVDALPLIIFVELNLGLILSYSLNNIKLIFIFNNLLSGTIGIMFLASCWFSSRPLIYYILQPWFVYAPGAIEAQWEFPYFRRCLRHITLIWGVGLIGECVIKTILVFCVELTIVNILNAMIMYTTLVSLLVVSLIYFGWTQYQIRLLKIRANQLKLDLERSLTIDY